MKLKTSTTQGFPGGSMVKNPPADAGDGFHPWSGGPLEEEMAVISISVLLPGKSRGQRSLAGCIPWGCKELDTTERLKHKQHETDEFSNLT